MTTHSKTPSSLIGAAVRRLRDLQGWTAQQLADRCVEVGAKDITAAVIANIETGRRTKEGRRRRDITVDEWLALALALDVPPLALLLPPEGDVEVTSAVGMDQMRLSTWAAGLTPREGLPSVFFSRQARPLRECYAAQAALDAAKSADFALGQNRGTSSEKEYATYWEDRLRDLARALEPVLRAGIVPAGLPLTWLPQMTAKGWLDASLIPPMGEGFSGAE